MQPRVLVPSTRRPLSTADETTPAINRSIHPGSNNNNNRSTRHDDDADDSVEQQAEDYGTFGEAAAAVTEQHHQQQQQQQQQQDDRSEPAPDEPSAEHHNDNNDNNDTDDNDDDDTLHTTTPSPLENQAITLLTRRLRCLFGVITWPIVPTGSMAALALLWFLYATVLDWTATCSHPLKPYAAMTATLLVYAPNHAVVRRCLLWTSTGRRRRPAAEQPPNALLTRRCNQLFHSAALLYVYAGISLVQTCRQDGLAQLLQQQQQQQHQQPDGVLDPPDDTSSAATATATAAQDQQWLLNTCQATCPNLYASLAVYVTALELFTFSLILPLLFLPCIYLWFIRQAAVDDQVLTMLQERMRQEEDSLFMATGGGGGTSWTSTGVTVGQIVQQLEPVKLVVVCSNSDNNRTTHAAVVGGYQNQSSPTPLEPTVWVVPSSACTLAQAKDANGVRECCICMNEFVVHRVESLGDDDDNDDDNNNNNNNDATRDVEMGGNDSRHFNSDDDDADAMIQTRACQHLFHKRCMEDWVRGGQWSPDQDTLLSSSSSSSPAWMRRRAKRATCPLCRTDLCSSPPTVSRGSV